MEAIDHVESMFKFYNKKMNNEQLRVWESKINKYSLEGVRKAVDYTIENSKYMPTIREFINTIRQSMPSDEMITTSLDRPLTAEEIEFNRHMLPEVGKLVSKKITMDQFMYKMKETADNCFMDMDWGEFKKRGISLPWEKNPCEMDDEELFLSITS